MTGKVLSGADERVKGELELRFRPVVVKDGVESCRMSPSVSSQVLTLTRIRPFSSSGEGRIKALANKGSRTS